MGIWKNFEEIENNLCLEELIEILESKREQEHRHNKFLAAMQGVNLDDNAGSSNTSGSGNAWEDMKARVFSKGKTGNANDILSLQGQNAARAGIGIGNGLSYSEGKSEGSFW